MAQLYGYLTAEARRGEMEERGARVTALTERATIAIRMDDRGKELWLPLVTAGLCIFLFFFSLLVLSLFLLGNFQNFLDSSQILLLHIFETASLLYVVAALYNVVLRIVLAVKKRMHWHTLPAVVTLVGAVFLFGVYLAFGFLFAWLKPLN